MAQSSRILECLGSRSRVLKPSKVKKSSEPFSQNTRVPVGKLRLHFRVLSGEPGLGGGGQKSLHLILRGQADSSPCSGRSMVGGVLSASRRGSGSGMGVRGQFSKRGKSEREARSPPCREGEGRALRKSPSLRGHHLPRVASLEGPQPSPGTPGQGPEQRGGEGCSPPPPAGRWAGGRAAAEILTQSCPHPWCRLAA